MAGGQGGGQSSNGGMLGFLWMLVALVVFIWAIWTYETRYVAHAIFTLRLGETYLIHLFVTGFNAVASVLHLPKLDMGPLWQWYQQFPSHPTAAYFDKTKFEAIHYVSSWVGAWMRYPVALGLLVMAYFLKFRHAGDKFRRTFSMNKLRNTEADLWPSITPILEENLVKTPLDEGVWAMAKLPLDFCKEKKILSTTVNDKGETIWTVNAKEAEGVFAQQMGSMWNGMHRQPIHVQALAAIFVAKVERDKDTERKLIEQISRSATKGGTLDMSGVKECVAKYKSCKVIRWLETRHAYTTTLMASLLELSRAEGVMASAEFLWLKPVDRRMWYMLNTVGRQTAVVEVAGPYCHWLTEKKIQRPQKTPSVANAAKALIEAIDDKLYVGEESSWRTSNAA